MNHFELFGLAVGFEVDNTRLATTYRELQRKLHPDNFAHASERDRLLAVQKTSQVNDAYSILKSPISRAEYILALHHQDIRGEQQTLQDSAFLMQQMELHERMEELSSSTSPEQDIADFDDEITLEIRQYLRQFSQLIDAENFDDAANVVRKLKFLYKIQDQLSRLEDSLID